MKFGNFPGTPPIGSAHGAEIDLLIWFIHGLMLILFVGWLAYYAFVLVKFRARKGSVASYSGARGKYTTYIEVGVAIIEGILLVGLSIPLWKANVEAFPADAESTVVEVMGRQYNWTAHYAGPDGKFGKKDEKFVTVSDPFGIDRKSEGGADDVIVVNDILVPVDKPVIFKITSQDVIHSFSLRSMRVMQDAIPGMMVPIHFVPKVIGTNTINCAQLCGPGHYSMKGVVTVVPQDQFKTWLKSKSSGGTTDYE